MSTSTDTIKTRLYFWNEHPVPHGYDEQSYSAGPDGHNYRNDCSGYVSMLTGMTDNPYTGAMIDDQYSEAISKSELRFGDIIIAVAGNGWESGHVVMFDHWINSDEYFGHEFGWGAAPAHRNIQYPYSDPDGKQDSRSFSPHRLKIVQYVEPAPEPSAATYTVHHGDTLSVIADRFGTTWQKLQAENDIKNSNLIYPGQVIKLAGHYVTVNKGDTLSEIASHEGTTWEHLASVPANGIKDPNLIYPGERIYVP